MSSPSSRTRRGLMTAMAGLSLGSGTQGSAAVAAEPSGSRTLVAYYSRSGNTRVVAGLIRRSLGADLCEIEPATAYPEDYLATVEQARQERDQRVEPALKATVARIASYTTIFLGFPIWGETAPPLVRSFLSAHDLSGKTLVPFITHGGYGLGSSLQVLASHAPNARLRPAFVMQDQQERQTMDRVNGWLGDLPAPIEPT